MGKILSILLVTLSFSAFAGEKYFKYTTGELTVTDPSIINLQDGTVDIGLVENCGFFRCVNQRLIFKSESGEKAEISLPRKTNVSIFVKALMAYTSWSEVDFSIKSTDSKLTLTAVANHGEPKTEIEFKEYKEYCEEICTNSYERCDSYDTFGRCSDIWGSRTVCTESTTRCTPAYDTCLEHTRTPISVTLSITKTETKEDVAKFQTKELLSTKSKKVSMARCFEK